MISSDSFFSLRTEFSQDEITRLAIKLNDLEKFLKKKHPRKAKELAEVMSVLPKTIWIGTRCPSGKLVIK